MLAGGNDQQISFHGHMGSSRSAQEFKDVEHRCSPLDLYYIRGGSRSRARKEGAVSLLEIPCICFSPPIHPQEPAEERGGSP